MEQLSFESLMTAHYDTLLRIAVQHTGNRAEAEDIVQDTGVIIGPVVYIDSLVGPVKSSRGFLAFRIVGKHTDMQDRQQMQIIHQLLQLLIKLCLQVVHIPALLVGHLRMKLEI